MNRTTQWLRMVLCVAFAPLLHANPFSVTTSADSGPGSLLQAIIDANNHPGSDTITFNISGAGVHTITPNFATQLPFITDPVTIDATTQPGFKGTPLIEISGAAVGNNGNAFVLDTGAAGSTMRGLVINHGWSAAIFLQASNVTIERCFLGTNPAGLAASGNTQGINANFGANVNNTHIGGTTTAARNLISGNAIGVVIQSGSGNVIEGNFIGTDVTGRTALGNSVGVDLRSSDNIVGGTTVAARNIVAGSPGSTGIDISSGASGNKVQGNYIGTDVSGTKSFGFADGILFDASGANQIGGVASTPGAPPGNVIAACQVGIAVGLHSDGQIIQGNLIGTDATGLKALGNTIDGIQNFAASNLIGGSAAGARNVIAASGRYGILLGNDNGPIHDNIIEGNFIGTDISGSKFLGNGDDGIFVTESFTNTIRNNVIAGNGGRGISINQVFTTTGISILGNSIHSNGGIGIDIKTDGVTLNDADDSDTGPNGLQNYPLITSVTLTGGNAKIAGTLTSTPKTAFRLEFFGSQRPDPSGFGEGEMFLGSTNVTTDAAGNAPYSLSLAAPAKATRFSATATDKLGSTSEFSPAFGTRLLNISTRMKVLTGENVLIGGFIITGTGEKNVLMRGLGPTLPVNGTLADPTLELHGSVSLANDNWKDSQRAQIEATGIPPTNDAESAIVASLQPGPYTAVVTGKDNTTGVGLVEVYDLDQSAGSNLANISTRGFVDTGDNVMIGGLIIGPGGTGPTKVLVRAIGPSLSGSQVQGALQDPLLELHDVSGATIATNDNWKVADGDGSQQAEIEATTIPPKDDRESALVRTLNPGNYTAIVRGNNNTTGVALVEVYDLQ